MSTRPTLASLAADLRQAGKIVQEPAPPTREEFLARALERAAAKSRQQLAGSIVLEPCQRRNKK